MLEIVKAYFLGIKESNCDFTTNLGDSLDLAEAYDHGRNLGRFFLRMD